MGFYKKTSHNKCPGPWLKQSVAGQVERGVATNNYATKSIVKESNIWNDQELVKFKNNEHNPP